MPDQETSELVPCCQLIVPGVSVGNNNWFWRINENFRPFHLSLKWSLFFPIYLRAFLFLSWFFLVSISLLELPSPNVLPSLCPCALPFLTVFHSLSFFSFCFFLLHNPFQPAANSVTHTAPPPQPPEPLSIYPFNSSRNNQLQHNLLSIQFPSKHVATICTFYYTNHVFFPT